MQTIEYRTLNKSGWGDGPWQGEPDKKQWQDAETGLPCLAVRGPTGAWCGYVGVTPDHPWHGLDYSRGSTTGDTSADWPDDSPECLTEVHGGLTFSEACAHSENESESVCHRPDAGEPDNVWWFGFDCAHCGDLCPNNRNLLRGSGSRGYEVYRDLPYLEREVASLAKQLAEQGYTLAQG